MIKEIKNKIEEIKNKVNKNYSLLEEKVNSKTISSEELEKYEDYFSHYSKSIIKFEFFDIEEFLSALENFNEQIKNTMKEWPNLKVKDKFYIYGNEIFEKEISLYSKDVIIFDKIFDYLKNKLGDGTTYCMLYKDFLNNNITLEQLIKIIELKG